MKILNYDRLNQPQQQQVEKLVAELEGKQPNNAFAVRFVARGNEFVSGGEFSPPPPA